MNISFEISEDLRQHLQTNAEDLNREAKEAFLVNQYRLEKIAHGQLAHALGLDAHETDGVLLKHGVMFDLSPEELREERLWLRDALAK